MDVVSLREVTAPVHAYGADACAPTRANVLFGMTFIDRCPFSCAESAFNLQFLPAISLVAGATREAG